MIGLGIAAASLSTFATGIESANVVGYNTQTLVAGDGLAGKYSLISIPFTGIDGKGQTIEDALSGNFFGGANSDFGDQIQVWGYSSAGIGGYTKYYYYTDETHEWDGWYALDETPFGDCAENADGLEVGWTAWYLSRGSETPVVTASGAVESSDDAQFTIYGGGYTLIASPYPVRLKLNDTTAVNWGDVYGGANSDLGDQIQVWGYSSAGIGGYTKYYYYTDETHEWDGWYALDETWFEDVDGNKDGLDVGQPFWYFSRDDKGVNHNITFFNPMSAE